jgi:hypothetical protein
VSSPLLARLSPGSAPSRALRFSIAGCRLLADESLGVLARRPGGGQEVSPPSWSEVEKATTGAEERTFRGPGFVAGEERTVDCLFRGEAGEVSIGGIGSFGLSEAGFVCRRREATDREALEQAILGPVLILCLALRGIYTFHGSAAFPQRGAGEGKAMLFLGESGAGKSTLAAALGASGWTELADDLLPLAEDGGRLLALADFPQLKRPEIPPAEPRPVGRVYVLGEGANVRIEPLSPAEAALALVRHTAAARLFPSALMERHLSAAARWAGLAAVRRLRYPRRRDVFEAVAEALEADGG